MRVGIVTRKLSLCPVIMTVRPYWNQIFADVFIDLLKQSVLFLRVCFQQDIDQIIFQYPNA